MTEIKVGERAVLEAVEQNGCDDTELRMIAAQITMMAVFLPLLQEYVRM